MKIDILFRSMGSLFRNPERFNIEDINTMQHPRAWKDHLLAVGVVFTLCAFMAVVYATFYFEARAHTQSRSKAEINKHLIELDQTLAKSDAEASPSKKEEAAKEKARLVEYSASMENEWIKWLPVGLINWMPWVVLTPAIFYLCRRYPLRRRFLARAAGVHLLAGLICGTIKVLAETTMETRFLDWEVALLGLASVTIASITYWVFVIAYNGLTYYKRYREREIKTSQLETQLAQAQLQVLKMQLHPHFLFNTLHAISTLIHRDVQSADRMICRLSDLLRLSLKNIELQEVPLREELDFLRCYLDIEQTRFGDRLEVIQTIAPETLGAFVPNLILQPIVENAVNHGIGRIAKNGRIDLRATKTAGTLWLEVCDNGPGLPSEDDSGIFRVGLANSRARLRQMYGKDGGIEFTSPEDKGLLVRLKIPYHETPLSRKVTG